MIPDARCRNQWPCAIAFRLFRRRPLYDARRKQGAPLSAKMKFLFPSLFISIVTPAKALRYAQIFGLHDPRASFDRLRMRGNLGGMKNLPHPEPVEGRTLPIQVSCKRLMRLANLCIPKRERGGPGRATARLPRVPAFAVMTIERVASKTTRALRGHSTYPRAGPAATTCSSYCGRSSVIVNHGALEPTKMCLVGRMVGSSTRVPMATWTKAPSRTTE